MPWHVAGTEVLTAAVNPSGNLDVSAVVGAQAVLVLLKVTNSGGGAGGVRVNTFSSDGGINYGEFTAAKTDCLVAGMTNASGVFDDLSGTGTLTVTVIGWADAYVPSSPPTIYGPGSFPGDKELDLSSEIGPAEALVMLGWDQTAGGATQVRSVEVGDLQTPGYAGNTADMVSGETSMIATSADTTASINISDTSSSYGSVTIEAAARQVDGWELSGDVIFTGAFPPAVWTDLDLSLIVGLRESLVLLRLDLQDNTGAINYMAVRPKKDLGAYLPAATTTGFGSNTCRLTLDEAGYVLVSTDDTGKIQWINDSPDQNVTVTILGYVNTTLENPVLSQQRPTDTTTELTEIGCRITDVYGIDTTTLSLTLIPSLGVSVPIITAGVIQSGWGGYVVGLDDGGNGPREVMVVINSWPDLPNGQRVTFSLDVENAFGGAL